VCCFSLFLVFILCSPIGYALAQSTPGIEGCPVVPANNIWNTPIDPLPLDPKSSSYANTIGASAGVHPDSGEAKQINPPQEPPPSPSGIKVSFWQWISGRKVDCSSGVCTFK